MPPRTPRLPRLAAALFLLSLLVVSTGCVSMSRDTIIVEPAAVIRSVAASAPSATQPTEELSGEEFSELVAIMRHDLTRSASREIERRQLRSSGAATQASERAPRLPTVFSSLPMPVAGLTGRDIQDNFGFPRDGGKRRHRGIDIFAPRGTPVIAVVEGYLSYIGNQKKGGRCVWLVNEEGYSFYYAHFDRWAPGIYEGMRVKRGDVIGFVGTTGNAAGTPPHLHFQVSHQDETVNPYPLLRAYSGDTVRPNPVLSGGFTAAGFDK